VFSSSALFDNCGCGESMWRIHIYTGTELILWICIRWMRLSSGFITSLLPWVLVT